MASSLISSSHHIDFDSIFGMEDASLAPVFESLITTGLKEFLGCPAIFYEAALIEFFANGSVRDGVVVRTIGGTAVEISESVFVATFELPSEGLIDLSDVPKNIVFDARSLFSDSKEQSARQEGQIQDDVQILHLNELKKAVIAQGISADTELLPIRNKFNALDAKILLLDGQVAAIRSEQLEFQAKIAADLLSLSTQIGNPVDYIRGGDAKKGEGSSSRPQPPPSNVQGQGSGGNPGEGSGPYVVRLTDISDSSRR
ncbi:hypothetical protein F511_24709 [Dorcoceras hygrometricum]|uniref:Uncharacterized protein n=1 Tax=Dorcoceras hygrometricum TaxID=472368 RepID=A0A2Z7CP58_9LAMI|nr:hypothetical protein F511_24709 [Dorcoceras hygrometricum]